MSEETKSRHAEDLDPPSSRERFGGPARPRLNGSAESDASFPRRVRLTLEGAWSEASGLAETVLDTLIVPAGGFSAVAFGWLTSTFFLALSIAIGTVIGVGGLILFFGLELLALAAYAFPGTLFLLSVAGGIAPALVLYWGLHNLLGIEGDWTRWGAYPLLLTGLFGSYYYWRFGRVIATTGEGALAFYRGTAPKAREIFGAPLVIFAGIRRVLRLFLDVFRSIATEFFGLVRRRAGSTPTDRTKPGPSPDRSAPEE